jgi:peptide/nickel transport system substrate-binding protein
MKTMKFSLVVLVLAAILLVAIACGAPATPPPPAVQTVVVPQTVVSEATVVVPQTVVAQQTVEKQVTVQVPVTPTPQIDKARAETLNIANGNPFTIPANINPYTNWDRGSGMHNLCYEYFFYQNLQTGEYIPWLATDYKYNSDNTALTVMLRDGVTWSDGQPFTADDVVFTYDMLKKNPSLNWAEQANGAVKSVDKVDDHTVTFNLTSPNPHFHIFREAFPAVGIWGGTTIVPKHIWESVDPKTFVNSDPVCTGPYKLTSATQQALTWTRRDDWWGTKVWGVTPAPKTVNFLYLGPETNIALALVNNELDTPNIGLLGVGSFEEVARRNPKVQAWLDKAPYSWLDPCPRPLMVNNAHPPFDKPEARWALSYLIDRQGVVDLAYEGATTPAWGIWPDYDANKPYHDAIADLLKQYPTDAYDEAKGLQMFKDAGVDISKLDLKYVVDANSNEEVKVGQVIADQLGRAGIKVTITPLQGGTLQDAVLQGDYDIKLHSFCPGYIAENLDLFNSKYYKPLGQKVALFEANSFRYRNPKLDAIVNEMLTVPPDDNAKMIPLFKQAMEIWLPDLPVIPVVQAPALVPFNNTYWTGWPTASNAWNMPVSWWATFNTVIIGYPGKDGKWVGGIKPATQ